MNDSAPVYEPRPTRKRRPYRRRTTRELDAIRDAIVEILEADNPATVRQVYYRLVSAGVIAKTESEYKRTVRLLTGLRREGRVPMAWIADLTRWMRKPVSYDSPEQALRSMARYYRRALWTTQPVYLEVWLEKDALAGVVVDETDPYDVPLMVTRGYPSLTFLHSGAQTIKANTRNGRRVVLCYLGDHDPSGVDIARHVEETIRGYGVEVEFERVAVTPEQIQRWNLPTRPTKPSDTRSKKFRGDSVEVDAIPPAQLRQLVRDTIEQHLDQRALDVVRAAEESERRLLHTLARRGLRRPPPRRDSPE